MCSSQHHHHKGKCVGNVILVRESYVPFRIFHGIGEDSYIQFSLIIIFHQYNYIRQAAMLFKTMLGDDCLFGSRFTIQLIEFS